MDNRLTADGSVYDFDDAMSIIQNVWHKVNPTCVFSEEVPLQDDESDANLPRISYELQHRKHSDKLSDGRKPRQLRAYADPEQPGHNITEVTEWFDCIAEFCIYGETKGESKQWTNNFENFLLTYIGYFKKQGVHEILFLEEVKPEVSTEFRQEIAHRRLRYLVRIQRSQILRSVHLQDVDVQAGVQTTTQQRVDLNPSSSSFLSLYENKVK